MTRPKWSALGAALAVVVAIALPFVFLIAWLIT